MICARFKREQCLRVLIKSGADLGLVNTFGQSSPSIAESNKWSSKFQQAVLHVIKSGTMPISANVAFFSPLKFAAHSGDIQALKVILDTKNIDINDQDPNAGLYPLHYAAGHRDIHAIKLLLTRGYDVNALDVEGYTPLMLAAKEGNVKMCELLISCRSLCGLTNSKGETALTLARKGTMKNVECVILDELARVLVLHGGHVMKHGRRGKGRPHKKMLKMVGSEGVL
nr:hypothetical protein [Tanacetum cinerariifolium]